MSQFGFDVANTKPSSSPDPLPPGWYAMRVTRADIGPGKSSPTPQLSLEFEIIETVHPEYHGRKAWRILCHHHESEQTRTIARADIKAILDAIGRPNAQSATEMLGGELQVKLAVQPASDGYDARNNPRGYRALSEQTPAPNASAAPVNPSVPATATRPAWKR